MVAMTRERHGRLVRRATTGATAASTARMRLVDPASDSSLPAWSDTTLDTSHGTVAVRQTPGPGMPVLFLHGNSASKDVFDRQFASPMGAAYRLIGIDFPGHGASSDALDPTASYTVPGYAAAAVEVLEQLGVDHAALVGWSLGGHVALEMAATFPGVTGLMVTGAPPVAPGLPAILAGFKPSPLLGFCGQASLNPDEVDTFAAAILGSARDEAGETTLRRTDGRARSTMFAHLASGAIEDEKALVATSGIPLAIVNGADDPLVDLDYVAGLSYAKLWRKRCHVLPRAGHACFAEQPALFNHLLAQFLRHLQGRFRAQREHPSLCLSG